MKPAPFDYVRAADRDEVLEVLRREGSEARILAGGQSLMPMLAMRLARPGVLVDVMSVPALRILTDDAKGLTVGAGIRQAALAGLPDLARRHPLLAAALPWIGHAQTRSRGTVCGSVAHADPSAELPLLLLALGGEVRLRSHRRARSLPAREFLTGLMSTAKADDEMVEAVFIPATNPGTGHAFREVGRRHGDYAIVACAAVADGAGVRLAIGGVADRPALRTMPAPDDRGLDDALDALAWDLEARDDLHATARYRRELVRRLGRATIEEAARCRVPQ
jgi:2-furoyl-CoA dehydrogenase FAD binding subunit